MRHVFINQCIQSLKIVSFSTVAIVKIVMASSYHDLTTNSPFKAHEVSPKAQTQKSALNPTGDNQKFFSLKGITKIGSTYKFSIYDNRTKKAQWINAGVPYNDFTIIGYNEESRTVEYIWSGKKGTIRMPEAGTNAARIIASPPSQELNNYSTVINPISKTTTLSFEVSDKSHTKKVYYSSKNSLFGSANPIKTYPNASKSLNSPLANKSNSLQSATTDPLKGKIHPALLRNRITPNRVNSRPHASDHIEAMEAAKRKREGF